MQLLLDRARPGAENMAIDRALLERGQPVIRLYGWRTGCVSLGYTQSRDDVDLEAIERHGFETVERPTGGGAILHLPSEVTYAVVLPTSYPGLPEDLFESYAFMSRGVLEALRSIDVDAKFYKAEGGKDAFCYLREAGISIVVDGRKVSGGAQRRTKQAVLQHGTVLVESPREVLAEIFREDPERIGARVASLGELGVTVEREELVDRLAGAFLATLRVDEPQVVGPDVADGLLPVGAV